MTPYILVGVVAFVTTFMLTPAMLWLARRIGAIDQPSDRKVHADATPTLGGLAIFLGVVVAGAIAWRMP